MRRSVNSFTLSCLSLTLLATLSGCTATSNRMTEYCAHVVASPVSDDVERYYTAMVVRVDNEEVVMRPQYELSAGKHKLRVVELIDSDKLTLPANERYYRDWDIELEPEMRYYIAARFLSSEAGDYWQPVVWKKEPIQCIVGKDNDQSLTVEGVTTSVSEGLGIQNVSSSSEDQELLLETESKSNMQSELDSSIVTEELTSQPIESTLAEETTTVSQKELAETTTVSQKELAETTQDEGVGQSLDEQNAPTDLPESSESKNVVEDSTEQVDTTASDVNEASSLSIEVVDTPTTEAPTESDASPDTQGDTIQSDAENLSAPDTTISQIEPSEQNRQEGATRVKAPITPIVEDDQSSSMIHNTSSANSDAAHEMTETSMRDKKIKNEQDSSQERSASSLRQ